MAENKEEIEEEKGAEGQVEDTTVSEEQVEAEEQETTEEQEPVNELDEFKDKYLRLYSDFENYRKRTSKEKYDLIVTAAEKVIVKLLPIVDDFERAEKAFEESDDSAAIKEGVDLIFTKLVKTLESEGLKPIGAQGEVFDPELHEAVTQIPAPSKKLKGKVVDEIEKGYYLGEKVVRYSKVVIGQ
jgi:molecular chaperone GrpE